VGVQREETNKSRTCRGPKILGREKHKKVHRGRGKRLNFLRRQIKENTYVTEERGGKKKDLCV